MKVLKNFYILIFLIIVFSGSVIIYFTEPGYLIFDNRMSIKKADLRDKEFYKNFNQDNFESSLKDYYLRDLMVGGNIFLDKYVFMRPFVNNVSTSSPHIYDFSGNNAYYMADEGYKAIDRTVLKLSKIRDVIKKNGGEFLIVPMPKISSCYDYPKYILDPEVLDKKYSDYMFNKFDEVGLYYLNPREFLEYEDFYKTDHHVSMNGGNKIIARIEDFLLKRGKNLNKRNIDVVEHKFKGSRARSLAFLTESEKIHEPIYDTSFKRTGDGHDYINDFKEKSNYTSYMYGDNKFTSVETSNDGADMIIYGDSFTNVVESFIWPGLKRMRSYDFREDLRAAGEMRPEVYFDTDLVVLIADENSFRTEAGYIFYINEDFSN